ncbi:hypothetical protein EG336_23895 [Vibrio parahaemolyticus]|nr:hypothetical protein [Vibrio parahaemolyticus]TOG95561.1 hypothetical protein CGI92_12715 [Vibrio parahaemolyticus]TOJ09558.1 hypothetical protein CGI47_18160 [Vibrio parahaemolyticus]TOJ12344.1 hypothetical protein CGI45_21060 [Vibrio parahaemolyticus]TOP93265.1 hypothetical protein CGH07_09535 [Vibrio parahaemolyticus]
MMSMGNRGKVFAQALPHLSTFIEDKRKPRAYTLGFDRTLLRLIGVCGFPAIAFCFIYTSNHHTR